MKRMRKVAPTAILVLLVVLGLVAVPAASAAECPVAPEVVRFRGETRYDTAVAVSKTLFPQPDVAQVVLINGESFADALSSSVPLAVREGGAVLPTQRDRVPDVVLAEIDRLVWEGGGTIRLIGGPSVISNEIETMLARRGYTPSRYSGPTRLHTAVTVAESSRLALRVEREAFLVDFYDEQFAEGLVANAAAGALGPNEAVPVIATQGEQMPDVTRDYISGHQVSVVAIGAKAAKAAGPDVPSVAGKNAYDTASQVAMFYDEYDPAGASCREVVVVNAERFADGLAIGPMAASLRAPVLLVPSGTSIPPETQQYFAAKRCKVARIVIAGGTQAVSEEQASSLRDLASCTS